MTGTAFDLPLTAALTVALLCLLSLAARLLCRLLKLDQ